MILGFSSLFGSPLSASAKASLRIRPHVDTFIDATLNQDMTKADGVSVVWPLPRNMKIDVATVLKLGLAQYGITSDQVPIITNGSFHQSQLRSEDGKFTNRPVIVVNRSSDVGSRMAVGNDTGFFVNDGSGKIMDAGAFPVGQDVVFKNEVSDVSVDVYIFDTNEERVEGLYATVKILMQAAENVFSKQLGYVKPPLRTGGSDSTSLQLDHPGGEFLVFERQLSYQGQHLDFIAGIAQVVRLVKEQLTTNGAAGSVTLPPVDV